MANELIKQPAGMAAPTGYSLVASGVGRFITTAGQVAFDETDSLIGAGDPTAQAEQVFTNLTNCLTAAGATWNDVIKLTYFVTNVADLPAIRAVRDRYVNTEAPPASSAVQVAALVLPELLVEIEAIAVVPA